MSNSRRYQYEQQQGKQTGGGVNTGGVARVIGYNEQTQTVDVQPLAKRLVNGTWQEQPPILDVPMSSMSGGGFAMSQKYNAGDVVTICYANQDIDNSMGTGDINDPGTERRNSANDAICMGGVHAGGASNKLPSGGYGMGSPDGSMYVVFFDDRIEIKSDKKLLVDCKDIIVTAEQIQVTGDVQLTGALAIEGAVEVQGDVKISGDLTVSGAIHGSISP